MTEQPIEKLGWPDLARAIALMVLAGISGFIVWSFHNADWPAFIAALVFGGFFGVIVGGLVGVHLFSSLATMAVFGGILEGIVQGWSRYGFVGAVLGGLIGIVAACVIVMLPMMLTHFVMIVCGIDPVANLDAPAEKKSESTPKVEEGPRDL